MDEQDERETERTASERGECANCARLRELLTRTAMERNEAQARLDATTPERLSGMAAEIRLVSAEADRARFGIKLLRLVLGEVQ